MSKDWIYNPKTRGSGIITCIPQVERCPTNCPDCYFQSGRSYLEPLAENLPHVPPAELAKGRIVRLNDGNDSNNQRDLVIATATQYDDYFFNTAIPTDLEGFGAPVVLTVNPGELTDKGFHRVTITDNLMFVRARTNAWNIDLITAIINYYTVRQVVVVLTFLRYYEQSIPDEFVAMYEYRKHITNNYYQLRVRQQREIAAKFTCNEYVYCCGDHRGNCQRCGNCLREYFNTKERLRRNAKCLAP